MFKALTTEKNGGAVDEAGVAQIAATDEHTDCPEHQQQNQQQVPVKPSNVQQPPLPRRRRSRRRRAAAVAQPRTTLKVYRTTPVATLPSRGTGCSAGLDLYCSSATTLPPADALHGQTPVRVPTGLRIALPTHTYGRVTGRSGNTMRKLYVLAGVVDADYRGPLDVMMVNLGTDEIVVKPGERIAQLVVEWYVDARILEVKNEHELGDTQRGDGGFGSTG